jgi:hypothetical protein
MGMSAYGDDHYNRVMESVLIRDPYEIEFGQNLHAGVSDDFMGGLSNEDIAASAQRLLNTFDRQCHAYGPETLSGQYQSCVSRRCCTQLLGQ